MEQTAQCLRTDHCYPPASATYTDSDSFALRSEFCAARTSIWLLKHTHTRRMFDAPFVVSCLREISHLPIIIAQKLHFGDRDGYFISPQSPDLTKHPLSQPEIAFLALNSFRLICEQWLLRLKSPYRSMVDGMSECCSGADRHIHIQCQCIMDDFIRALELEKWLSHANKAEF